MQAMLNPKKLQAEVVEPTAEEIRVETPEEKERHDQAERRRAAEVAEHRVALMKYVGEQSLAWERGLHVFDVNAKDRFDGVAPEVLGEVGKGVLGYVKSVLVDTTRAAGLDAKVKILEKNPDVVLKPGVEPLSGLTEGVPLVGTALSATKFVGSRLEAIHQQQFSEMRATTLTQLVHWLIIAGNESLSVWQQFIEQASPESIEQLTQRIDRSKPMFYGADVASLCERLLFDAMSKVQPVRETIHHMNNLSRFITEDIEAGIGKFGPGFVPSRRQP